MTAVPDPQYFRNREEWRAWLEKNHEREIEIWLLYYKKNSGKPCIPYEDTVEEAICFGWIDSNVKRIDDEKYMQKYSPRKTNSVWSKINRERAQRMIKNGRMTQAGLKKIEEAKRNGRWDTAYTSKMRFEIPADLRTALKAHPKAWDNFNRFANSYQNIYIGWINNAKRKETRKRRINEVVKRAILNQKPGLM